MRRRCWRGAPPARLSPAGPRGRRPPAPGPGQGLGPPPAGLRHLYVRLGDSRAGFSAAPSLDRILPAAHAAGLDVIGWDFPYLADPGGDAERAGVEIAYATTAGDRLDGFAADIETAAEGVDTTADSVSTYGLRLRQLAGDQFPLIATV